MRRRSLLSCVLSITAIGFLPGCGDDRSPLAPSRPEPSPFSSVEVIGPDVIYDGQSVQFVANIRQADGTTKSGTSMPSLVWRSSNTSVIRVSNAGWATATPGGFGEAVITADLNLQGTVQGVRRVVHRPRVTAAIDVGLQGAPGQRSYVFTVTLSELAGVPTTVTALWIDLDEGWSGQCFFTPQQLGLPRLLANDTFALEPLTCGVEGAFTASVSIEFRDDNGYRTQIFDWRELPR
jgi:hypothetical protein